MWLKGRDGEPVIFSGPGRIEITKSGEVRFYMYATATDTDAAFRKIRSAQANPYNALEQFRLVALDFSGTEWEGGYTSVGFFDDPKNGYPFTGKLTALSTLATGDQVAKTSSVELLMIPPVDLPASEWMVSNTAIGEKELLYSRKPGRQIISVLGTDVEFLYEPSREALWITALTSEDLPHPYAEKWLAEPLRIMLGSLVYPQMVARNMGDGTSHIWFRPSSHSKKPSMFGLKQPFEITAGFPTGFWEVYARILTMIGSARDDNDRPNFEAHEVTRFYQELAQARHGSRWMKLLTLASTAEAMTKALMTDADRKSEYTDADLASMSKYIGKWEGNKGLRSRLQDSVAFAAQRSPQGFMRSLAKDGVISNEEVDTWRKLRNSVAHGNLVEPWPTQDGDRHLGEMISLVHKLTHARIEKGR
jgi:hypothetical protein